MRKLAMLLAVALVLVSPAALADVAKGDRGEEVRYLQWLLQQTGRLNETPDGIFGGHTEQAIMDYQAEAGLEPTGIADASLMLELDKERVRLDKQAHGPDYYAAYTGKFEPPAAASATIPAYCMTTVLQDMAYRDSCERHLALLEQEQAISAPGSAEAWREVSRLWLQDIEDQYAEWAASSANGQVVTEAWNAWSACFEAQRGALIAAWGDEALAERQLSLMLKYHAGTLCELRSGQMKPYAGTDLLPSENSAQPDAHCATWSIGSGAEFFLGCADHAPLYAAEYAQPDAAAAQPVAVAWDGALAKLYERWQAVGGDAVAQAQARFADALSLQDAALAGDDALYFAHARAVQLECARLCELLNTTPVQD